MLNPERERGYHLSKDLALSILTRSRSRLGLALVIDYFLFMNNKTIFI